MEMVIPFHPKGELFTPKELVDKPVLTSARTQVQPQCHPTLGQHRSVNRYSLGLHGTRLARARLPEQRQARQIRHFCKGTQVRIDGASVRPLGICQVPIVSQVYGPVSRTPEAFPTVIPFTSHKAPV